MYTIILADKTPLKNLELNGNNFIAPGPLENSIFEGKLSTVTIDDGTSTEVLHDMVLVHNTVYSDGRSWFVLEKKSSADLEKEALQEEVTGLQLALVEVYEQILGGK